MKRKAASRTAAKKAPKKEKAVKKAAKKKVTKNKVEKKKAPAKKRNKKAAEPVAVQGVEPAGSETMVSEATVSGSMVDEVGAGTTRSDLPRIDLAAGEPVIHAPVGDGSVPAEARGNGAVSAELASDIEEDLRLGREFMKKYWETFRALAK